MNLGERLLKVSVRFRLRASRAHGSGVHICHRAEIHQLGAIAHMGEADALERRYGRAVDIPFKDEAVAFKKCGHQLLASCRFFSDSVLIKPSIPELRTSVLKVSR